MSKYLISLLVFMGVSTQVFAGDLTVKITDFRNANGNILISFFTDKSGFDTVDPQKVHTFMSIKTDGKDKEIILKDFPSGKYAITILHDENGNLDMDVNNRDFPTEGYGFSNNVGTMSIPSFEDAVFSHEAGKDSNQTIKLVYIM